MVIKLVVLFLSIFRSSVQLDVALEFRSKTIRFSFEKRSKTNQDQKPGSSTVFILQYLAFRYVFQTWGFWFPRSFFNGKGTIVRSKHALDSRSLETLWEWKNRVLLEEYYIFNVAIPLEKVGEGPEKVQRRLEKVREGQRRLEKIGEGPEKVREGPEKVQRRLEKVGESVVEKCEKV